MPISDKFKRAKENKSPEKLINMDNKDLLSSQDTVLDLNDTKVGDAKKIWDDKFLWEKLSPWWVWKTILNIGFKLAVVKQNLAKDTQISICCLDQDLQLNVSLNYLQVDLVLNFVPNDVSKT